jgi:hypothetical protein
MTDSKTDAESGTKEAVRPDKWCRHAIIAFLNKPLACVLALIVLLMPLASSNSFAASGDAGREGISGTPPVENHDAQNAVPIRPGLPWEPRNRSSDWHDCQSRDKDIGEVLFRVRTDLPEAITGPRKDLDQSARAGLVGLQQNGISVTPVSGEPAAELKGHPHAIYLNITLYYAPPEAFRPPLKDAVIGIQTSRSRLVIDSQSPAGKVDTGEGVVSFKSQWNGSHLYSNEYDLTMPDVLKNVTCQVLESNTNKMCTHEGHTFGDVIDKPKTWSCTVLGNYRIR